MCGFQWVYVAVCVCVDLRVVVMGMTWLVLRVRMVFTLVMTYELPQSELWCGRVHLT